ncbi:TetR/AcrR family transcriptional regulator [Rathayibacter caricis]|uniref:TetR/AcrR family transcriptional regulator n=1 Tax=Rathayibacter caricis TaxID=110936 RepID=UPI001FB2B893|nr:TetR/AcrR family transcriptional regulator [Rathayibacter caricis]MCJ1696516.1 TetR/AcrR family transcriptional regulator [Rathayibacter caricis]
MDGLRRDAARNRERILQAARELLDRGDDLALNAVARAADVGVGTVYRHFATLEELEEVVVWDRFDELDHLLRTTGPDGFERTLVQHIALLTTDPLFERVTARPDAVLPQTAARRAALLDRLAEVLEAARSRGRVRPDVDAAAVLLLACGAAHSLRSAGLAPEDAPGRILVDVVLRGLRPEG